MRPGREELRPGAEEGQLRAAVTWTVPIDTGALAGGHSQDVSKDLFARSDHNESLVCWLSGRIVRTIYTPILPLPNRIGILQRGNDETSAPP